MNHPSACINKEYVFAKYTNKLFLRDKLAQSTAIPTNKRDGLAWPNVQPVVQISLSIGE
jgi:hypothetical protein